MVKVEATISGVDIENHWKSLAAMAEWDWWFRASVCGSDRYEIKGLVLLHIIHGFSFCSSTIKEMRHKYSVTRNLNPRLWGPRCNTSHAIQNYANKYKTKPFVSVLLYNRVCWNACVHCTWSEVELPLGSIHTCNLLGLNYCVNFSVHTIDKSEYSIHYWTFQTMQKLTK